MKTRRLTVIFSIVISLVLAVALPMAANSQTGNQFGSLDGKGVALALEGTSNADRLVGLKALVPQIRGNLSGRDFAVIIGIDSSAHYRARLIAVLAKHARKELEADEVVEILGNTENASRLSAIKVLTPAIKYGLSGQEIAKILGTTKGHYRGRMIGVLANHSSVVGSDSGGEELPSSSAATEDSPEAARTAPDSADQSQAASESSQGLNENSTNSYESVLPVAGISQRDVTQYFVSSNATKLDRLNGKDYPISNLACLATVYAMIEQELGDPTAKIDDFYENPGEDGVAQVGAFIPPSDNYLPLSGRSVKASFREVSRGVYDKDRLVTALDGGGLAILEGKRADGFPHFILINGYKVEKGVVTKLSIRDPWDNDSPDAISAEAPSLNGFSFNKSMRLIEILDR